MQRKNSDSNTKNKKGRPLSPKDYLLLYCNMYKQITSEQRYTISILLQQGMKKKDIATAIKVSPDFITFLLR